MASPSSITVQTKGALQTAPATCNAAGVPSSQGVILPLDLTLAVASAPSNLIEPINAVAPAWQALPFSANFQAELLAIRKTTPAPLMLRLTYAAAGQVVVPIGDLYLATTTSAERITAAELQGQGDVAWVAGGAIV